MHEKQDPYFSCEILRKHSSLSTLILNLLKGEHIWLSIQIQFSWLKLYQFSTYCYVGHRCNNYCEENRGWQLTSKVINLWEVCDIRGGTYFEWAWASDVNWHQWWTEAKVYIRYIYAESFFLQEAHCGSNSLIQLQLIQPQLENVTITFFSKTLC